MKVCVVIVRFLQLAQFCSFHFFIFAASPISDVCARPDASVPTICAGDIDSKEGEKCCWKVVGGDKSYMVCDTCWRSTNEKGWTTVTCSPPPPLRRKVPFQAWTLRAGLRGGGVFEIPDNGTLPQNISKNNDSSTLTELQSDVEHEAGEQSTEESDAEEEQDENEENGNSNEEE